MKKPVMNGTQLINTVLLTLILLFAAACSSAKTPVQDISYEVKFLLDPEKVLDEDHLLKEEWVDTFGITEDYLPIEVMYLDTPDKTFFNEGWINRLRRKSGKKKVERTYKKRYPVTGTDIAAALENAKKDGFTIPDPDDEASDDEAVFEPEVDWGYEKMTLSFSLEDSGKMKGHESLATVTEDEAKDFLAEAMPDLERDWTESQWGISTLESSKAAGPVSYMRAKGTMMDREVTVEIWPAADKNKAEESYIVELSFKADDLSSATDDKTRFTDYFDQQGILLHEDSLKTQQILDAGL